jgi:hypothetical protein
MRCGWGVEKLVILAELAGLAELVLLALLAILELATPGKAARTPASSKTTTTKPIRYLFFVSFI